MSEKDQKIIDQAFSTVRKTHEDEIAGIKEKQVPTADDYNYKFNDYSESKTDRYSGAKGADVTIKESVKGPDGSLIFRTEHRDRVHGRYGNSYGIDSKTVLPTSTGEAHYASSTSMQTTEEGPHLPESTTGIVRTDENGNVVYKFTAHNPEIADKVGAIAAKRIIDAANTDQLDRAA